MEYGIIFEGDTSPLVEELSEALFDLGLYRSYGDTLSPELLSALNTYRAANRLICLDFCDPVSLRMLGIDCEGDEIMVLARYAPPNATLVECYDIFSEIVAESRKLGITVVEAAARRNTLNDAPLSESVVAAAVLAFTEK